VIFLNVNSLKRNWNAFIYHDVLYNDVQSLVAKSWEKCKQQGVDPELGIGKQVGKSKLSGILNENKLLLDTARPIMHGLHDIVKRSNFVMVLTDSAGCVLETIGNHAATCSAKDLRFEPGSLWSELQVGSNAIGTALDFDSIVQMVGPEHYCVQQHNLTCSAAPIHGLDGEVIGCLDMSSTYEGAHPHTLGLVTAAALSIETQLMNRHNTQLIISALDVGSDGILLLGSDFRPFWANRSANIVLKLSMQRLKEIDFRTLMPDVDWSELQHWYNGGQFFSSNTSLRVDGNTVYCSASIYPALMGAFGRIFYVTLKRRERIPRTVHNVPDNRAGYTFDSIYTKNPYVKKMITLAKRFSRYDGSILIEGASGTGKEMFAQAIHNNSERSKGQFVAINCASLPRELIESELFGYEKGAFTGALREGNPGKFELADHGTIFLDEISEMPFEFQSKLLRVVDTKIVSRLGGSRERNLDVRIIAATNRSLKKEVEAGRFRDDLYFRLNVLRLYIPPLCERPEDIHYCADYFLECLNHQYPELQKTMSNEFKRALEEYPWPGNVRELKNSIERAFFSCDGNVLTSEDVYIVFGGEDTLHKTKPALKSDEYDKTVRALLDFECSVDKAAASAGISRATMYRRINRLGIHLKQLKKT